MPHHPCRVALVLGALLAPLIAAEGDWPQYSGPQGNFTQTPLTMPLVDDLAQSRLLWTSEATDLPAAKLYITNKLPVPSGGMQSLVVAEGRLVFAYMMPSGDDLPNEKAGNGGCTLDKKLLSDDTILTVDAQTGKTLWKRVFAGQGYYLPPTKRGGYGVTPAIHAGAVYWLGPSGRLYAVDAASGEPRWQAECEPLFSQQKEDAAASLKAGVRSFRCDNMLSSLVIAEGVVVVPLFVRGKAPGVMLAGYDAQSGQRLWQLAGGLHDKTTPAIWKHAGREWLLIGTPVGTQMEGEVRLVDPRSGAVAWTLKEGLAPQKRQLTVWNDQVLLPIPATAQPSRKNADDLKESIRYAAYRLSPTGASRIWEFPDTPDYLSGLEGDGAALRTVTPDGDRFYRVKQGVVYEHDSGTGAITRKLEDLPGCWATVITDCGDRLLFTGDAEHYHTGSPDFSWIATDGPELRQLAPAWNPFQKMQGATAYEVPHMYFVDQGRLYLRSSIGVLRCYDLRKP